MRLEKPTLDLLPMIRMVSVPSPIRAAVALLAHFELGRRVLVRQVRSGQGGRPFGSLKFWTMRDALDAACGPLSDAGRLMEDGKFLCRTGFEECRGRGTFSGTI
jgi:lipopolysaccharide/colanic/teichoic acid biosynthesis glycosyltransferase